MSLLTIKDVQHVYYKYSKKATVDNVLFLYLAQAPVIIWGCLATITVTMVITYNHLYILPVSCPVH